MNKYNWIIYSFFFFFFVNWIIDLKRTILSNLVIETFQCCKNDNIGVRTLQIV